MEEIEDEYWEMDARMPKVKTYMIEKDKEDLNALDYPGLGLGFDIEVVEELEELAPPPMELRLVVICRLRMFTPGDSALGVSVLSIKGWIKSVDSEPVNLRIDSCADITLVSEEYHTLWLQTVFH
ncbi:hypothetical protein C8J57DRAFT_1536256 [Mycena rebaudengoi]|nr:hypothetical protein C8J57DRAFT_1536256 [Mycena rebaudengoi]